MESGRGKIRSLPAIEGAHPPTSTASGLASALRSDMRDMRATTADQFQPGTLVGAGTARPAGTWRQPGVGVGNVYALPAAYDPPDLVGEYLSTLGKVVSKASSTTQTRLQAAITPEMIAAQRESDAADQAVEFDDFIHREIDYSSPAGAALLKKVAPDFIERRMAVVQRDAYVKWMDSYLFQFGPETREDLEYMFLRSKGMIKTSDETRSGAIAETTYEQRVGERAYRPGALAAFGGPLDAVAAAKLKDGTYAVVPRRPGQDVLGVVPGVTDLGLPTFQGRGGVVALPNANIPLP